MLSVVPRTGVSKAMQQRANEAARHRPTDADIAAYEATTPEGKAKVCARVGD